jgi:hypothetical protein
VRDRDVAAIFAAAHQFEQIGALLSAADAAAQAASAFEARGDRRRTVDAAAVAHRLAAECGGIRTPALDVAAHPLPLTMREREIANLVAAARHSWEASQCFDTRQTTASHRSLAVRRASFHRTPAGMPVSGSRSTTTSPTRPGSVRSSQVFNASASMLSRLE